MIDKEYREFIRRDLSQVDRNIYFLKYSSIENKRKLLWLRVLGLIETWDMIK